MKIGKYKINIEVDNQQANQELQETSDELKNIETNMDDVSETGDALTGGLVSSFKNVQKGVLTAIRSLRTLKGVLIATGIGAFALAIGSVTAAFQNSEEGQNKFARIMGQIAVVTGNVLDIMSDLGNAVMNVGKILVNFFRRDFDAVSEAFNDLKGNLGDAVDGVKNFGEETRKEIKIAGQLADARAKADKIERQLLVDRAEADRKRAELLEKAVDRERFSTEERIGFLQEASALDEEITKKEIALKNEEKAANEAASKAAEAEIKAQELALQNFQLAEREALAINEDEKKELQVTKTQERYDALIEQAKKFGRDTAALEDARTRAIALITAQSEEETGEIVEAGERFKLGTAQKFLALGIGLATEGSNAAKALGIANAIIATYAGAAQALNNPLNVTPFQKAADVALVLATGFQQIRAIQQTQIPVLSVGGTATGGVGSAPVAQIQPPAFNVVGASPINQLTEAIAAGQDRPVKAFVVAGDVTTAQELDRNTITTAGI